MQPMVVYPNQGQVQTTTVVQAVQPGGKHLDTYICGAKGLGTTQVTIGIVAFICQIVALFVNTEGAFIVSGIWTGIFFIITGILGIASAKHIKKCGAAGFLCMNILSTLMAMGLMGIGTFYLIAIFDNSCYYYRYFDYDESEDIVYDPKRIRRWEECRYRYYCGIAVNCVLIFLGLLEFIIAIISSGYGCGRLCCCVEPTTSREVIYQSQPGTVAVQGGHSVGHQPQQVFVVQGQGHAPQSHPTQPPAYQMYPNLGQFEAQQAQPEVQQFQPEVRQVQPEVLPKVQQVQPLVQQVQPIVQQAQPVVQQAQPVVQQAQPVVQQAQPVVQQAQPVIQQAQPEVQQVQPETQIVEPSAPEEQPKALVVQPCAPQGQLKQSEDHTYEMLDMYEVPIKST